MKLPDVTRLLAELVSIPSVNPMAGADARISGEGKIADYLRHFFRRLKFDVELQEVETDRPNVVARFAPRRAKRTIALAPHTDTVSVANMSVAPFGARIRGGKLYGRGACDTKGSMAAMLWAMGQWVQSPAAKNCRSQIVFTGLMGEESGNNGARALMRRGFRADFAIVGEPTGLEIVHAHKGALWFALSTRGKTAHASTPRKGHSAIYDMARALDYLRGEYSIALARKKNELLGSPTVNVGVIRGGQQINIVPDHCRIEVDRRTLPDESHAAILSYLRRALAARGVKVRMEIVRDCCPLETRSDHPLILVLRSCVREQGPRGKLVGAPWFCDAAIFAEHGIPAVAFGPGRAARAHTANEFIELEQLQQGAQIFLRFLHSI